MTNRGLAGERKGRNTNRNFTWKGVTYPQARKACPMPRTWRSRSRSAIISRFCPTESKRFFHETHVPAVGRPSKENTRIPRADEDGQRTRRDQRATREGSQARRGLGLMPRGARAEGFPRRHRFAVQGSFGAVLRNSRKLRSPHAVLHISTGMSGSSRLGVALTRRLMPSAVERNRMKRALREVFRRHPVKGMGFDLVVMFRSRFEAGDRRAVVNEVKALLDQASAARP